MFDFHGNLVTEGQYVLHRPGHRAVLVWVYEDDVTDLWIVSQPACSVDPAKQRIDTLASDVVFYRSDSPEAQRLLEQAESARDCGTAWDQDGARATDGPFSHEEAGA